MCDTKAARNSKQELVELPDFEEGEIISDDEINTPLDENQNKTVENKTLMPKFRRREQNKEAIKDLPRVKKITKQKIKKAQFIQTSKNFQNRQKSKKQKSQKNQNPTVQQVGNQASTVQNFGTSKQRTAEQKQKRYIRRRQKRWLKKVKKEKAELNKIRKKKEMEEENKKKEMEEKDPQLQFLKKKLLDMGLDKMNPEEAEKIVRHEFQNMYKSQATVSNFDESSLVYPRELCGRKENGNIFMDIFGVSKPKPIYTIEDDGTPSSSGDKNGNLLINHRPVNIKTEIITIDDEDVQKIQNNPNQFNKLSNKKEIDVVCLDDSDLKDESSFLFVNDVHLLPGPSSSTNPQWLQQPTFPKKTQKTSASALINFQSKEGFLKSPSSSNSNIPQPSLQTTFSWHLESDSWRLPTHNLLGAEEERLDPSKPKIIRTINFIRGFDHVELRMSCARPDLNLYLDSISHYAAKMKGFHFRGMEKANSNVFVLQNLNPSQLRIVSYNVLCQNTIQRTRCLYTHLNRQRERVLEWDARKILLALELVNLKADIYCLQEVEDKHYVDFFEPLMREKGYQGFLTRKTNFSQENVDGCAIFISSKLEKVFLDEIYFNFQTDSMDKDNVAQILCVKIINSERYLLIGNTHILFNKKRGDIKLNQLAVFFAHINQAMEKAPKNSGLILCGDFNLEPFSKIYEFIAEGRIQFGDCMRNELSGQGFIGGPVLRTFTVPSKCLVTNNCLFRKSNDPYTECTTLQHSLNLASVYEHTLSNGAKEISSYHKDYGCPDYIFYTVINKSPYTSAIRKIEESGIHLVQKLSLPSKQHYNMAFGRLPNEYAGSDHIPLLADFYII